MNDANSHVTSCVLKTHAWQEIEIHRTSIDCLDNQILHLLSERLKHVHEIGEIKKAAQLNVFDPERESRQYKRLMAMGKKCAVPIDHVVSIFRTIMSISKKVQQGKKVLNREPLPRRLCSNCNVTTCGIEIPECESRVCPACSFPLY